jgi:hypothetical protein
MTARTIRIPVLALVVAFTAPLAAQDRDVAIPEAEQVVREFFRAAVLGDREALARVILPHPNSQRFVAPERPQDEAAQALVKQVREFQLRPVQAPTHRGQVAQPDGAGHYPDGTVMRYMAVFRGNNVTTVVKRADGWKIDLRWWSAQAALATEGPPKEGTADFAARGLLYSVVELDRTEAAKYALPGVSLDVLFAGAPSYREPSGHLQALVMEMPILEASPGELVRLPSGQVVEGSSTADRKVLVGLFGMIEVAFVTQKVGGEWRVVPQPYFLVINR